MPNPESVGRQGSRPGRLVIFFGMTASGKSTLGKAWAAHCRAPYYNTDRVRKELAGLKAADKRPDGVGQGIYSAALTEATYRTMLDRALGDLASGAPLVVLDGSYSRREDRNLVRAAAEKTGAKWLFVHCFCGEEEVRRRLALRASDAEAVSDGRWEIYVHQQQTFEQPETENDCLRLGTEQPVERMVAWLAAQPFWQD